MIKQKLHYTILIILIIFISGFTKGITQIPNDLMHALSAGNSKKIAKYFNSNVELKIFDNENIYSKQQAQLILEDFFKNNEITDFKIIHQGNQGKMQFAIGKFFIAKKQKYMVHFLIQNTNNKLYITRFTIEKNNF